MKALHVIPVRITDVKQFIKHYNLDDAKSRSELGYNRRKIQQVVEID